MKNYFNSAIAVIATWLTYLLGTWDTALMVLIVFMCLDQFTGVLSGYINKKLSSDTGLKGIARKVVIFVVLMVAVMLDRLLKTEAWLFRTMICYFYIANEGLSILENCICLGLPVPEKLKEALEQLKQGNKKEVKSNEN